MAIGTDLWFATITNGAGSGAHHRAGRVDWRLAARLLAGGVDDGKNTRIGRLLHDGRAILADPLHALACHAAGPTHGEGAPRIDPSLLADGLEAEREQGVTIDVAYRCFGTRRRKSIIADAAGHEQYTRNMVTAAAGSDTAVVLVDITKPDPRARPVALLPQTRRHARLAAPLHVPGLVFAVNKLDAVEHPRGVRRGARGARSLRGGGGRRDRRHRAGVGATGRQRCAAAGRRHRPSGVDQLAPWTVADRAAREPAHDAGAHRRDAARAGAVRRARERRHRPPAAHAVGSHRARARARRRRGAAAAERRDGAGRAGARGLPAGGAAGEAH